MTTDGEKWGGGVDATRLPIPISIFCRDHLVPGGCLAYDRARLCLEYRSEAVWAAITKNHTLGGL